MQLIENFTLAQKVATNFGMIHILASGMYGTVHAVVPSRTFVSTITVVCATNFDIYTGAVILLASSTQGAALQPDRRPREADYKKRAGGCKGCSHFIAANLRLELACKRQYGHEDD